MVLVGLLLLGVGLPVAFTLGVMRLGFGDRLHGISSIGSALLLAGIGTWLWARSRAIAACAGAALLAACLVGQVVALRSWSRAGADVVAVLAYVADLPSPETTHVFVEGPPPNRNGVIGATSPSGGANEAYLRAFPDADPDGPEGGPPTGSLTVAPDPSFPAPEGAHVVTWTQVLNHEP